MKIFIVTGELSGEAHAARVLNELYKADPTIKVRAMGSKLLEEMGAGLIVDYREHSFNGFTQVIANLPKIFGLRDKLAERIIEFNPDLILGVDYSGFNLELAKSIKEKLGAKSPKYIQYIGPQIWASRPYRINKVKKYIDKLLCTLPFEEKIYKDAGVDVSYVGNPVASSLTKSMDKTDFLKAFDKVQDKEEGLLIGVFPGSRKFEVQHLLPELKAAALEIRKTIPESRFVLAKTATISSADLFASGLDSNQDQKGNTLFEILEPKMMLNANHKLLSAADCLWLCSGTVTLEAALYHKPYFLTYRADWLSYQLYKLIRTIDKAGLANIIAGKNIVKEFIQKNAKKENFVAETYAMLDPEYIAGKSKLGFSDYYSQIESECKSLDEMLNYGDTAKQVAAELMDTVAVS